MIIYREKIMMIQVPMDRAVKISLSTYGMEFTGDIPKSAVPEKETPIAMTNSPAQ